MTAWLMRIGLTRSPSVSPTSASPAGPTTTLSSLPTQPESFANALDRLSHLYQASRYEGADSETDIQLVTVTSQDGNEERLLVHVPRAMPPRCCQPGRGSQGWR